MTLKTFDKKNRKSSSKQLPFVSCFFLLLLYNSISFSTQLHAQIPGWTNQDIGSPKSPGSSEISGDDYTVTGNGFLNSSTDSFLVPDA